MADPVLFDDCKVWVGGNDLTGECDRVDLTAGRAQLKNQRFGDQEVFHPGILAVVAKAGGFWSAGAGSPDAIAAARITAAAPDRSAWPFTVCPPWAPAETAGADGNIAYNARVAHTLFRFGARHGDLLPFELDSRVRSRGTAPVLERLTVLLPKLLRTGTATGTGRELGSVAATDKLVSVVHLFAITGGSLVITVESDNGVGFGTPVTRITHAALTTAPNRDVQELAGAIATDTWFRVVATYTPGTNFTVACLVGIAPF